MSGLLAAVLQPLRFLRQGLHTISQVTPTTSLVKPDSFSLQSIRTNVRCYFPRPNEVKRVRRHGWKARMSTPAGRRIIMRRLLKGRFVLTH
ncbi:39S ribosomal protein L34, mitochondrial [Leguminivora glycinivorella]|uniref:39S ribosomal protein L34, mitochondrial n=1 Tax=Leguminivora glycinivorella TaxID=1035111 RepID=UPI00201099C2|nr:39S ribosomal protein L34, mitochondrial [Leguminivora glycinivorella]